MKTQTVQMKEPIYIEIAMLQTNKTLLASFSNMIF